MFDSSVFASPPPVPAYEDCAFYHTMEIPGHGLVEGQWDLRGGEKAYLGGVDFAGKRVLELGTADGFLCFYMEGQGAEVVTHDLSDKDSWDLVPYSRPTADTPSSEEWKSSISRLNKGYWFAHHAHGSRARACYSSIYDIPVGIGRVDIAVFGSILLHVRDPFLALHNALRLTGETAIIADLPWRPAAIPTSVHRAAYAVRRLTSRGRRPAMTLLPDHRTGEPWNAWWRLPPELIMEFLGILGFEKCEMTFSRQMYEGKPNAVYTIVAHRTSDRHLIADRG